MVGLIEDVHVDILGTDLIIQRGFPIGTDEAVAFAQAVVGFEVQEVFILMTKSIPVGEKHDGVGPDRFAFDADDVVLPLAVFFYDVDVFIGQVDAPGKGNLAVDHHDLAVVTVIDDDVEDDVDAVEGNTLDAFFFQCAVIGGR